MTYKTLNKIYKEIKVFEKKGVIVFPLKYWSEIESILEDYFLEKSKKYLKSIQKAREDIKKGRLYKFNLKSGKFTKLHKN